MTCSTFQCVFFPLQVRQGLKTYSNWPTYPQLYVKGELIGGLDIVKVRENGGTAVSVSDLAPLYHI